MSFPQKNQTRKTEMVLVGLILLSGLLIYVNALGNGFVFDDHPMVEERVGPGGPPIGSVEDILLRHYRPVRDLGLAAVAAWFGPYPIGFHLANVFLHLLNAVWVFVIVMKLSRNRWTAASASLIFTVHPVQTDAVAYISGFRDTLFTAFVLSGVFTYLRFAETKSKAYWIATAILFVLGLGAKEMAVGLLPILFLIDVANRVREGDATGLRHPISVTRDVIRRHYRQYVGFGFLLIPAVGYYVFLRGSSVRIQGSGVYWWGGSFLLNLLTVPKLWVWYLKKLILPLPLMADYMNYPMVADRLTDPLSWISLFILAGLFATAVRWLFGRRPLWGLALAWVLLTLLPVVQILPHHELMAEHHLYLPSVGFSFLLALMINDLPGRPRTILAAGCAFAALAAVWGLCTVERNREWKNDFTLFHSNLSHFPSAPRSYMQLGNFFMEKHLFRTARESYQKALSIKPDYEMAHNNLGALYFKSGDPISAVAEYRKALQGPLGAFPLAFRNLARAQMLLDRPEEAIDVLKTDGLLRPGNLNNVVGLYYAFKKMNNEEEAGRELDRWLRIRPDDPLALVELAAVKERALDFDGALRVYDRLESFAPGDPSLSARRSRLETIRDEVRVLRGRIQEGGGAPGDYLRLAEDFQTLGAVEEARKRMAGAAERFPDNPEVFAGWVRSMILSPAPDTAGREQLERGAARFGGHPEMDLLIGRLMATRGRINEAFDLVRRAVKGLAPGNPVETLPVPTGNGASGCEKAWFLGRAFKAMGEYSTALDLLDGTPCRSAEPMGVKKDRAEMLVRLGSASKAVPLYVEILRDHPGDAGAHNALAFLLIRDIGDYETAELNLAESLRLDPDQAGAADLRAISDLLENYVRSVREEGEGMDPGLLGLKVGKRMAFYNDAVKAGSSKN